MRGAKIMIKITAAKKQELTERLKWLVDEGRRDDVEKIKEARSFGDLSENSEYDIAREHQRKVEEEISELTNVLDEKNHVVIAFKDSYDHVEVGCQVVIQDMKTQEKKTFKLLGKYEADPYATPKIISDESPLGKALVGKKVGELANFEIKNSKIKYRILSITSAR